MAQIRPSTRHFLEYLPTSAPTTVLGYISSGPQSATVAPFIVSQSTASFNFTGDSTLGGHPVLPLTVTAPFPSGMLPGDVVVAKLKLQTVFPGVGGTITDLSPTSGWTEVFSHTGSVGSQLYLLTHVVTGSELPTVTFTYPAPASNFSGYSLNVILTVIRGANTTTPIDNFVVSGTIATTGSAQASSISVSNPQDLILIYLEPAGNTGPDGAGHVSNPGTPAGTNLEINFQSPNGALEDSCFLWSRGPGNLGPFLSATGWPNTWYDAITVAILPGPVSGSIQGFPVGANGPIVPFPVIIGIATKLVSPQGMWIDTASALWVADAASNTNGAILVFGHPATSGTNTPPDINITGGATTLLNPYDVVTDIPGNIYIANYGNNDVLIFTTGSNGNVAPSLSIVGNLTLLAKPRAIAVASNGDVFVINDTVNAIYVWTAGHTGNRAPDRTIAGAATLLNNPLAMRFDSDGHLWVTNAGYLLEFLETDTGNVAPQSQVSNAGLDSGFDLGIDFDINNNIYVSELLGSKVFEFQDDSISGIPLATITGWLTGPWGIAVNDIVTPPPMITCIPLEWQTRGRLIDEGRLALCRRFFIDINTSGEQLTVVICVDDVDYTYPFPIGNNGRSTIEIALQVTGRIYSTRLVGCTTFGQVELFDCWPDLWEGAEEQVSDNASQP